MRKYHMIQLPKPEAVENTRMPHFLLSDDPVDFGPGEVGSPAVQLPTVAVQHRAQHGFPDVLGGELGRRREPTFFKLRPQLWTYMMMPGWIIH